MGRKVRQVLIETHGYPNATETLGDFFPAFQKNHFALFSKEINVLAYGYAVEFSFIKLHPDFWATT